MRPILAITVSDQDLIAIIGLMLAAIVGTPAWLNWMGRRRNTARITEMHEWVRPNGNGTLVEMLEAGLVRIEKIEHDLERIRGTLASITGQVIDHEVNDERRFSEGARRMGLFETRLADLDGELAVVARELAQITSEVARSRGA